MFDWWAGLVFKRDVVEPRLKPSLIVPQKLSAGIYYCDLSNWTPAFAGGGGEAGVRISLKTRGGGLRHGTAQREYSYRADVTALPNLWANSRCSAVFNGEGRALSSFEAVNQIEDAAEF